MLIYIVSVEGLFRLQWTAKTPERTSLHVDIPSRLKLLSRELYLISGPSNINLLWKNSDTFTPKAVQLVGMRNVLKLNPNGARFCESDDSGRGPRPHPSSNVKFENRIWFHTHDSAAIYLSGLHLKPLVADFQHRLGSRMDSITLDDQRMEFADLYGFLYDLLSPTQIDTLFGTSFLAMNPNFAFDFREFHRGLPYLLRGYPRWLSPKAWDARERCLESIKGWHAFCREKKRTGEVQSDEERTLFYGSRYIENRQAMHSKMKALDADAIASSELGVIWA